MSTTQLPRLRVDVDIRAALLRSITNWTPPAWWDPDDAARTVAEPIDLLAALEASIVAARADRAPLCDGCGLPIVSDDPDLCHTPDTRRMHADRCPDCQGDPE